MTCLVFSLLELTDSYHKSTSADQEESEIIFKKKYFENRKTSYSYDKNQITSPNPRFLDGASVISRISINSFCSDKISYDSDLLQSREFYEPACKIQKTSPTYTLTCFFNEGDQDHTSVSVYIELQNDFKLFTKEFVLRLLDFFEKLSIDKSLVFINRKHKDYCKLS